MDRPPPDPGNTDPAELTEDNPDLDRDREELAKEPIRDSGASVPRVGAWPPVTDGDD